MRRGKQVNLWVRRVRYLGGALSVLLFAHLSFAQVDALGKPGDPWRQEGRFFTIRISLNEPVRIFVAGKEEAKIDFSKMSVAVRRLRPYPPKILVVSRYDNYFQITDSGEFKGSDEIEIVAKSSKLKKREPEEDTFHFSVKQSAP